MAWSKTSRVWAIGVGAGVLTAIGGALVCTGVGAGAGAVAITSGLAAIGGIVGGGMLAGIGVIGAGSATAAALASAIAQKVIKDPELLKLAEKLRKANEVYEAAKRATEGQRKEIEDLNQKIGDLLRSKKRDQGQIDALRDRLAVLIAQLRSAA